MSYQFSGYELTNLGHFLQDLKDLTENHGVRIGYEFYLLLEDGSQMRAAWNSANEMYLAEASG